ncbi:MAG: type II secretion system F family protein [bacterium]
MRWKRRRISREELLSLNNYLISTLTQGLPLLESMKVYLSGLRELWLKDVFVKIVLNLERGFSFSAAISSFPKVFPKSYISIIKVGEEAENISQALQLSVKTLEKEKMLKEGIIDVIDYSAIIFCITIFICLFILVFVIPAFKEVFTSFGQTLPLITRILISLSDFLIAYFFLLVMILIVLVILFVIARKRGIIETVLSKIPFINKFLQKEREMNFCRTLSILLKSGCSLIKGLQLTEEGIQSRKFRHKIKKAADCVRKGNKLSRALNDAGGFSKDLVWTISLGEERENLPDSLWWLSEYNEIWIRSRIDYLVPLIERSANICIGLLVAFMTIALYAPIFFMGGLGIE